MSDFVTPLQTILGAVHCMLLHLSNELELPKLNSHSTRDLHAAHFVSLTRDLNTVIFNNTFNRTGVKWKVGFGCLNPDDLARVEADPAMQRLWVETWRHCGATARRCRADPHHQATPEGACAAEQGLGALAVRLAPTPVGGGGAQLG
jgi:hypothetical protein